jgi:hypothetical protein
MLASSFSIATATSTFSLKIWPPFIPHLSRIDQIQLECEVVA